MFLIIRHVNGEDDYFGPFPTEDRANEYAKAFNDNDFSVVPLIVPNCVQVKLMY